ncbi:hypothetical protein VTN00DRAFT_2460 [Thermoascus crustaceus]|uniref:uncharacterized protein n=1 Tax=Thermoascus crustaceus TaxID=5088 RepID=UPI0037423809
MFLTYTPPSHSSTAARRPPPPSASLVVSLHLHLNRQAGEAQTTAQSVSTVESTYLSGYLALTRYIHLRALLTVTCAILFLKSESAIEVSEHCELVP